MKKFLINLLVCAIVLTSTSVASFASEHINAEDDNMTIMVSYEDFNSDYNEETPENTSIANNGTRGTSVPTEKHTVTSTSPLTFNGSVKTGYTLYTNKMATGCSAYTITISVDGNSDTTSSTVVLYKNGKAINTDNIKGDQKVTISLSDCSTSDTLYLKFTSGQATFTGGFAKG